MSTTWSEHVRIFREKHGCTYKQALQQASISYVKKVKQKKKPVVEKDVHPIDQEDTDLDVDLNPPPPQTPVVTPTHQSTKMKKQTKKQKLIEMCEKLGLDSTGTVKQLSERLEKII